MDNHTLLDVLNPKIVDVCPTAFVLHKLVRYNLLPCLGGGVDFTYQDLVVVAMILKGVSFNLSFMILQHMMSCLRHTKQCLPYSVFSHKILLTFQNLF